ncbi:MAG: DUF3467 domain-containing protein [Bacteroidaceae bacterium]|nr:DUF3467 domain-containing protein [Bacteroidaceae bacterium]
MSNKDVNNEELQVDVPAEVAQGVYANRSMVSHSSADFVVDFFGVLPGLPRPILKSRVVLAPEHAKRLFMALADNVRKYEQTFGEIKLPMNPPMPPMPFPPATGEA